MTRTANTQPPADRGPWMIPCLALLAVLGACAEGIEEEQARAQAAAMVEDPWVDAIEAEEVPDAAAEGIDAEVASDALAQIGAPVEVPPESDAPEASSAVEAAATAPAAQASGSSAGAPDPGPAPSPDSEQDEAPAAEVPAVEPAAEPAPAADPPKPAPPAPLTVADFHGNYRYAGGQSQRDGVADAVEKTVQSLAKALHGIARRRLSESNPVDTTVKIAVSGDTITTTFASGFSATCVVDGGSVETRGAQGEKLDVRVRWKGDKLVQVLQGKQGARTVVYVLSSDRERLTVHHKITASRLPEALTYRLSYSRK